MGCQILSLLKSIHEKGLIHRDIKPDNFLFGISDKEQVYLIDFGFCKSYLHHNEHIPCKKTKKIIGSANFASIHSHEHMELSRRDDLESLGYVLYYLYNDKLPWSHCNLWEDYENHNEKIKGDKKNLIYLKEIPLFLKEYMKTVHSLSFEETPPYDFLTEIMR